MVNHDLLNSIIWCDQVAKALNEPNHACKTIVSVQRGLGGGSSYQVPEPWRGDIQNAPLLFISSNPSIDLLDDAPWSNRPADEVAAYYQRASISSAFPRSTYHFGVNSRNSVRFWRLVNELAIELYGDTSPILHGEHYAITEVVHCKSQNEYGVRQAMACCPNKFLRSVLAASNCKLIVSLGDHAETALRDLPEATLPAKVLYLAHPCAWGSDLDNPDGKKMKRVKKAKTVRRAIQKKQLSEETLRDFRKLLNDARSRLPS